nr:MAG TPA: hypothetical protein [Caudoviricetes sp.]
MIYNHNSSSLHMNTNSCGLVFFYFCWNNLLTKGG